MIEESIVLYEVAERQYVASCHSYSISTIRGMGKGTTVPGLNNQAEADPDVEIE